MKVKDRKYFVTGHISENIHETPEGYLICVGVPIARTGEMEYGPNETPLEGDEYGHVVITRDEDEVFRPETIASFEGKAITISHPNEFVGPDNWKTLAKGVLQNVRRGTGEYKDDLLADLMITDEIAIGLVKNGLREVSCGYEADYEQTEKGKGKQLNIIGNHLALVESGRAGPQYKINDHKGEEDMNLKDRIKQIFGKAQDDALALVDAESKKTTDKTKTKDEDKEEKKESTDAYDELVKMVDALGAKIEKLMGAKDQAEGEQEEKMKDGDEEEEKKSEDKEENEAEGEILERVKALEAAVEKLLSKAGDEEEEESEDEEEEKSKDSDEEESMDEEEEDDDFEESTMVGDEDTVSRAEILAPGLKATKDVKVKALKAAYGTKDGKEVIHQLTGGKAPAFDSKEKVNTLFIAASELLKAKRGEEFTKTKKFDPTKFRDSNDESFMTPEKLNELNAKHYAKRA